MERHDLKHINEAGSSIGGEEGMEEDEGAVMGEEASSEVEDSLGAPVSLNGAQG